MIFLLVILFFDVLLWTKMALINGIGLSTATQVQKLGLWQMSKSLLLWTTLPSGWPVRYS